MPAFWMWDPTIRRYRVTREGAEATGQRVGTIVGKAARLEIRDGIAAESAARMAALARDYADGKIPLTVWVKASRTEMKTAYINQYLLGTGGKNAMSATDWGRLGNSVRTQNEFFDKFAGEVKRGEVTAGQLEARATMYANGSTAAYERAEVLGRGMSDLPQYPGDGKQTCKSNCRCTWQIVERELVWECTWQLSSGAKHCKVCLENAENWAPLIIEKRVTV